MSAFTVQPTPTATGNSPVAPQRRRRLAVELGSSAPSRPGIAFQGRCSEAPLLRLGRVVSSVEMLLLY